MKSRCSNEESNQSCWILVDLTNSVVIRFYHLAVSPTPPTIKFRTDSQELNSELTRDSVLSSPGEEMTETTSSSRPPPFSTTHHESAEFINPPGNMRCWASSSCSCCSSYGGSCGEFSSERRLFQRRTKKFAKGDQKNFQGKIMASMMMASRYSGRHAGLQSRDHIYIEDDVSCQRISADCTRTATVAISAKLQLILVHEDLVDTVVVFLWNVRSNAEI